MRRYLSKMINGSRIVVIIFSAYKRAVLSCSCFSVNSWFTMISSSLVDWSSSLDVSSSSFRLCISSLELCNSSLELCSSSLAASMSSVMLRMSSRVNASSFSNCWMNLFASLFFLAGPLCVSWKESGNTTGLVNRIR